MPRRSHRPEAADQPFSPNPGGVPSPPGYKNECVPEPGLKLALAITAGNYLAEDQWIPPTRVLREVVLDSIP